MSDGISVLELRAAAEREASERNLREAAKHAAQAEACSRRAVECLGRAEKLERDIRVLRTSEIVGRAVEHALGSRPVNRCADGVEVDPRASGSSHPDGFNPAAQA